MRFFADGPAIPDELLNARDEGRVVLFAGAGVSRARARLPDFFGLAGSVVDQLGVPKGAAPRRLIEEAAAISERIGEGGLISADRVFGLLERAFPIPHIHSAVARALRPDSNVDVSAHRLLVDLAKRPDGSSIVITTNFDRLFEQSAPDLPLINAPRLPNLSQDRPSGIIHLHGVVTPDYEGSVDGMFVLSSSEFGRAYLAEGWATAFIRTLLENYVVVFIGYTADDPPVQYLLEALNRIRQLGAPAFAFQSGEQDDARAKWLHKGVQPISYDATGGHVRLWDSLEAWAGRARNVGAWYRNRVEKALSSPSQVSPHERGQIAHVVKTVQGAKFFAETRPAPSAEWLCVFDPRVRFGKPGEEFHLDSDVRSYVDPFDLYGLDDDQMPQRGPEEAEREIPKDAWDAFALNVDDVRSLSPASFPTAVGPRSSVPAFLPTRLFELSRWLAAVANEPAAIWWAAGQKGMHPTLREEIERQISLSEPAAAKDFIDAWESIFASWDCRSDDSSATYRVSKMVKAVGWTAHVARKACEIYRPHLEVERPLGSRRPPSEPAQMISVSIRYPTPYEEFNFPSSMTREVVRSLRGELELAVALERQVGPYGLEHLAPINEDESLEGDGGSREFGIGPLLSTYVRQYCALVQVDRSAALEEFDAWWRDDLTVFARLRIWASKLESCVPIEAAVSALQALPDKAFWDTFHRRDLLISLSARWQELSLANLEQLADRLLRGPPRYADEDDAEFGERSAETRLTYWYWLRHAGCAFPQGVNEQFELLRAKSLSWRPEWGHSAARSLESSGGTVRTDRSHAELANVPIKEVAHKARELRGHVSLLVERDPFSGLSGDRPIRALAALRAAARSGDLAADHWRTFLYQEKRQEDPPRLMCLIASRLARLPLIALLDLIQPVSSWMLRASEQLLAMPVVLRSLWVRLIEVLRENGEAGRSSLIRQPLRRIEWATEALNSPTGRLAQLLMKDPVRNNVVEHEGVVGFDPGWLADLEALLALPGDAGRYASVLFAFNTNWFYTRDSRWTQRWLLSRLELGIDDRDAVLAGLFWAGRVPSAPLYTELKGTLFEVARDRSTSSTRESHYIAAFLLEGWSGEPKLVSSDELRGLLLESHEELRLQVLDMLERWGSHEGRAYKVLDFVREVWPKQSMVRTPRVSVALCELAFSNANQLNELVDEILPLLTPAEGEHIVWLHLADEGGVASTQPWGVLRLLDAVLPTSVSLWPYKIDTVLDALVKGDPKIGSDPRYLSLRQRWMVR